MIAMQAPARLNPLRKVKNSPRGGACRGVAKDHWEQGLKIDKFKDLKMVVLTGAWPMAISELRNVTDMTDISV